MQPVGVEALRAKHDDMRDSVGAESARTGGSVSKRPHLLRFLCTRVRDKAKKLIDYNIINKH